MDVPTVAESVGEGLNARGRALAVVRVCVGLTYCVYGVLKLLHMQRFDIVVSGEITQVPGNELFWYFFGYSRPYLWFVGLTQLAGGLMMAAPKTRRIGALMCLVLGGNITIMDFAWGIGWVSWWALFLTVCCIAVVAAEWRAYRRALAVLLERS